MLSAMIEFLIFSVPSWIYSRKLRRRGSSRKQAWAAVGMQFGKPTGYWYALGSMVVLLPLANGAMRAVPSSVLHNPHVVISNSTTVSGIVAAVLLAFAEEMFFRGFMATLLISRYGFAFGNALQACIFLLPHLLLLLVSTALWPLVLVQLLAGWMLGWVRHKSGSIVPGGIAHAAVNIIASLLLTI